MFINPINQVRISNSKTTSKRSLNKSINFTGYPKADVAKNQMKILLSQDIWAPKLKVKMPESQLEKETLLEILENRLKLDKYVRLFNERRFILSQLAKVDELRAENPRSAEADKISASLAKRGNISSVLATLNKQIEQEEKRNQSAIKYFEDLDKTFEEYIGKKLVKYNQLDKAWHQLKKNNLNPNGELSTAELIEIVKSGKGVEKVVSPSAHILSRKDLINTLEKEYEELMRKSINIYATSRENQEINNQYDKSRNIRYQLNEKYGNIIKKYPGMDEALKGIYSKVEKKYSFKVNQLTGVDIYPIGEIWDQMKDVEKSIKTIMEELPVLKEKFAKDPSNKTLEMEITGKEIVLVGLRDDWTRGAKLSVDYEAINQQRMADAGHLSEYEYLTSENKTLNKHKLAMKVYNENNQSIPEDFWSDILK